MPWVANRMPGRHRVHGPSDRPPRSSLTGSDIFWAASATTAAAALVLDLARMSRTLARARSTAISLLSCGASGLVAWRVARLDLVTFANTVPKRPLTGWVISFSASAKAASATALSMIPAPSPRQGRNRQVTGRAPWPSPRMKRRRPASHAPWRLLPRSGTRSALRAFPASRNARGLRHRLCVRRRQKRWPIWPDPAR